MIKKLKTESLFVRISEPESKKLQIVCTEFGITYSEFVRKSFNSAIEKILHEYPKLKEKL